MINYKLLYLNGLCLLSLRICKITYYKISLAPDSPLSGLKEIVTPSGPKERLC